MNKVKYYLETEGYTFGADFANWEIWVKGNERMLYCPNEDKIMAHYEYGKEPLVEMDVAKGLVKIITEKR